MNPTLIQCVVESLRVSGPANAPLACLEKFNDRDWWRFLPWLHESGLALYFLNQLTLSGSLGVLPTGIRVQLEQDLVSNRRRLAVMKDELGLLLYAFDEARVNYLVLKGLALVPEFCPDAALRSQYDYDFLIHPDSSIAARGALEARGYSLKTKNSSLPKQYELLFSPQALTIPSSDLGFYSVSIPRDVELHLSLWESNQDMLAVGTPPDVISRKRLANWQGSRFPVLADEDALIAQALHAFQHMLAFWCKPSWFLEISYFLHKRRDDSEFWKRLQARASGHQHLSRILGVVFSMSEMLFSAPVAPELTRWTTCALPESLSQWIEEHGRKWALARFPGSKLSLFVHREFIADPVARKQLERQRLFPFHRPPAVVEPGNQCFASSWRAWWQQQRFVLDRLNFHLKGLLTYAWERCREQFEHVLRAERRHTNIREA